MRLRSMYRDAVEGVAQSYCHILLIQLLTGILFVAGIIRSCRVSRCTALLNLREVQHAQHCSLSEILKLV